MSVIRPVAVPSHAQRSSGGWPHRRYDRMVTDRPGGVGRSICGVLRRVAQAPVTSSPPTAIASKSAAVAATRLQSTAKLSARRSSAPVTAIVSPTSAAMLLLKAAMSGAIGRRQRAKWKAISQARSPTGGSKAMSSGRVSRRRYSSLRSTGRRQTVSIRPKGGDIASVDVVLARAES